jgi:hypothetical protein
MKNQSGRKTRKLISKAFVANAAKLGTRYVKKPKV